MAKISRDSNIVELDGPPLYDYGDKVVARFNIRNDGTYRGRDIGDLLVKKGDVGYVSSIGTFLQQYYIYGVDFYERGTLVGMRSRELLAFEPEANGHGKCVTQNNEARPIRFPHPIPLPKGEEDKGSLCEFHDNSEDEHA